MLKLLILTADQRTLKWETLDKKLAAVKLALNSGHDANFSVDIQYKSVIPKVDEEKEKIDNKWLSEMTAPYFKEYDIVAFHFSKHQRNVWGIQPSLRGSNPKEDSELESLYFWSDEDTLRLGYSQFVETLLHEVSHSYFQQTKLKDITHDWHSEHKTIVELFKTLDWSKYQPKKMALKKLSFIQATILALKTRLASKTQPVVFNGDLLPLVKRQADKVLKDMELLGLPMRMTEGYRSPQRQDELYAQGRTTPGKIVTNARAGESLHNYGVACDFVFRKQGYDATNDQWLAFASIAERHGFEWGGSWNEFVDRPHIQMMKGYKLKDFQSKLVDLNKYK